jgi:hypothetical protein
MLVEVFVKFIDSTLSFKFPENATLKDLKRRVRNEKNIPMYIQRFNRIKLDNEKLKDLNGQTLNFYLPFFSGPNNFENHIEYFDNLNVLVSLPGIPAHKIMVPVMSYWTIQKTIENILEKFDKVVPNNYNVGDVQLKYGVETMPENSRLCYFKDLTRGFMQFTQIDKGIPKYFLTRSQLLELNIFQAKNPYGYIIPIGKQKKTNQYTVVLQQVSKKLKNKKYYPKCFVCGSGNIYVTLPCSDSLCKKCSEMYESPKCKKCNKDFF